MKRLSKFLVLLAATALVMAAAADALYAAQHKKSGFGGSTSTYPCPARAARPRESRRPRSR